MKIGRVLVVGADGRSTKIIDHTKRVPGPDTCKIITCGKSLYFVLAAEPAKDVASGLDFRNIAREACAYSATPDKRGDRFLTRAIRAAKRVYRKERKPIVVYTVFFGLDHGEPLFHARAFRYSGNELRREREDCSTGCAKWTAGGFHSVIDTTLANGDDFFRKNGLIDGVRLLVDSEINANGSREVGPPISILKLEPSGHTWIRYGACQNDGK